MYYFAAQKILVLALLGTIDYIDYIASQIVVRDALDIWIK